MEIQNNNNEKRDWWEWLIITIACLMIAFGLSSCKQIQYVPVEKVITKDSLVIQKDYDSIYIKVKEVVAGDTVYRDSIEFRYVYRSDTIREIIRDSVPYPVPVVKEVERSLNEYEKTMIRLGWVFLGLILAFLLYKSIKLYLKSKGL